MLPKFISLISDLTFLGGGAMNTKVERAMGTPFTSQEIAGIEEAVFFTSISTSQYWPKIKKFNSPLSSLVFGEPDPLVGMQ